MARNMLETYFQRTGQPHDSELDAAFSLERNWLRETLDRLEVVLQDEHVPSEIIQRVIRCMIYGAPSVAEAELRIEMQDGWEKTLAQKPPVVHITGLDPDAIKALGLPPKDGS